MALDTDPLVRRVGSHGAPRGLGGSELARATRRLTEESLGREPPGAQNERACNAPNELGGAVGAAVQQGTRRGSVVTANQARAVAWVSTSM